MLGYGTETKAYRLYDLEKKKVFFSRDVLFNELKSGIDDDCQPQESKSGTKVIQLDYLSEDEKLEEQVPQTEETDLPLRRSTQQRKHQIFIETGSQWQKKEVIQSHLKMY